MVVSQIRGTQCRPQSIITLNMETPKMVSQHLGNPISTVALWGWQVGHMKTSRNDVVLLCSRCFHDVGARCRHQPKKKPPGRVQTYQCLEFFNPKPKVGPPPHFDFLLMVCYTILGIWFSGVELQNRHPGTHHFLWFTCHSWPLEAKFACTLVHPPYHHRDPFFMLTHSWKPAQFAKAESTDGQEDAGLCLQFAVIHSSTRNLGFQDLIHHL